MAELPNRVSAVTVAQSEREASCEVHGAYIAKGFAVGRKVHWMGCPDCSSQAQTEKTQAEAARSVAEAQRRLESSLNQAGIPARYRRKTFESYVVESDAQERALCVAMEFAANFDKHRRNGTVIVFSGVPGTGKSHLAIAIAQTVMARNTALYTSAIDAVRMIRNTWRRDSDRTETQVLDMLASVDLLVLDEVGMQYGTDAEQVSLFDIIDKRYRALMPTILLTNQGKKGLRDFLGDRSFDRLREGGEWVVFDWESYRGRVAA